MRSLAVMGSRAGMRAPAAARARVAAARWLLAVLAVVVAGAAGCGISADSQPHPLVRPRPFQGFTSPPSPQTPGNGAATEMEILYLIRDNLIARVSRSVAVQPTVEALLDDLTAGPTEAEAQEGYTTALATAVAEGVRIEGSLAIVTLGEGIDVVAQGAVPLAIGQIVCTLDAHPDVTAVVFERNGSRASVPRGDATQTDQELTTIDYESVLEPD